MKSMKVNGNSAGCQNLLFFFTFQAMGQAESFEMKPFAILVCSYHQTKIMAFVTYCVDISVIKH